jgi:beta-lactamase regulating signal transducer with metallopeptidase domain
MMAVDFQILAQASAGRVLNTIAEGVALAGLSWVALRFVGGRSAVTRFAVWFSTLLAVVSLPLLVRTGSTVGWRKPELELSGAWAKGLVIAWAAIASVLLVRLGVSLWHVRQLRRECREIDARGHAELAKTLRQNVIGREVALLVSDEVRVPTALGFFRPAVVLPAWALHELSSEELKIILLHELAHLRRWDDWTNLAQKILKAVFFFHPAVWWIEGRLALEREMACDDMVLEQTANPVGYAASLVSIAEKAFAEKTRLRRALALAQGALGQMRQSSLRIAQILDPGRSRTNAGCRTAVAAVAGIVLVALVAAPYVPEVISFQQPVLSAVTGASVPSAIRNESGTHVQFVKTSEGISERAVSNTSLAGEGAIRLRSGQVRATLHPARPAVIPARMKVRHAPQPHVVLATAKARRPDVVLAKANLEQQPAPMLLVVQSTEIDPSGSLVWTLCVWRVSPGDQGMRQIEETIVMHSI